MKKKTIVSDEDDPDTLQLLDEMDVEWVSLWRKACKPMKQKSGLGTSRTTQRLTR
ncbi:MAG: hypothetical protein ABSF44_13445 [Candidatus Bathyarchaeia archaeon]